MAAMAAMAISEAMEARAVMGLMAVVAPGAAMEARAGMVPRAASQKFACYPDTPSLGGHFLIAG